MSKKHNTNDNLNSDTVIMKFQELRDNNFTKISDYYQKITNEYYNKQQLYKVNSTSLDQDKQYYSENIIRNQIGNYEDQIININMEMINLLNKNDDIILLQKKEIEQLNKNIETKLNIIGNTQHKLHKLEQETTGHNNNKTQIIHSLNNKNYYHKIYIIIIILLIIFNIILLSYNFLQTNTNNYTNNHINKYNNNYTNKYNNKYNNNYNNKTTTNTIKNFKLS